MEGKRERGVDGGIDGRRGRKTEGKIKEGKKEKDLGWAGMWKGKKGRLDERKGYERMKRKGYANVRKREGMIKKRIL